MGGFLAWGTWAGLKKHMWLPSGTTPRPWWQKTLFVLIILLVFSIGREQIGPQLVVSLVDGFNSSACADPQEILELEPEDYGNAVCRNFFDRSIIGILFRIPDEDKDGLADPVETDYGSSTKLRTKLKLAGSDGKPSKKGKTTPITP